MDERMRIHDRLTADELRELTEKAQELDRRSAETDQRVQRAIEDLDRLAKRIRQIA